MCKLRTVNVCASAMKLNSHHAFHPQGTVRTHRKGMSRVGLFAFLNYCPVRQKQRAPLGRLTIKRVRSLASRRENFVRVSQEHRKVLEASRLNVLVPVEIELTASGSSSILRQAFRVWLRESPTPWLALWRTRTFPYERCPVGLPICGS